MEKLLAKAIRIASEAFENKFDKSGEPYILHCLYVMRKVRYHSTEAMIVAVLHDLLEDCPEWTVDRLLEEGFPQDIVFPIKALTKFPKENYAIYLSRVIMYELSTVVKLADLEHNMKMNRLKGVTLKDFERMEKYSKAYILLKKSHENSIKFQSRK